MTYDLNTQIDRERFKKRVNGLYAKRCVVECTEFKPKRTDPQNRYLHVILGEFAMQYGERLEYVKREYFKRLCNPDLFETERPDKFRGTVKELRSSRDLNTEEMTLAIERFRNWSSQEAGIYLPDPHEEEYLAYIEREMQHQRQWI